MIVSGVGCSLDTAPPAGWSEPPPFTPAPETPVSESPPFGGAPVVEAATTPLSPQGGTLLVSRDGRLALVGDSDRDVIHLVDLNAEIAIDAIAVDRGAEPGRMVEDHQGRFHVALRRRGEVMTIEAGGPSVLGRRTPCASPQGLAFDGDRDELLVACAGGRFVRLAADPEVTTPVRTTRLPPDLRDVAVATDGTVYVTRFRSAELLVLDDEDELADRVGLDPFLASDLAPRVAWRMIPDPQGGVLVLHQGQSTAPLLGLSSAAYYHPQLTQSLVTAYPFDSRTRLSMPDLYVDLAVQGTGDARVMGVAGAGVREPAVAPATVRVVDVGERLPLTAPTTQRSGLVAVAFAPDGRLWAQERRPAQLVSDRGEIIPLPGDPLEDTGYDLFHLVTPSGFTCAHCHPGGGDDGHVWTFDSPGPRRTQTLESPVAGVAPFHWDGAMATFGDLVSQTMDERMRSGPLTDDQLGALARYVDRIPAPPGGTPADPDAAERGRTIFQSPEAACAGCHGGERFTNGEIAALADDGPAIKVPSLLGAARRAPYLHDGRADTLTDALMVDGHGGFAGLDAEEQADLLAYLATL